MILIHQLAQSAAWVTVLLVVLYAALRPAGGVFYDNPLACVGVGLIGLGLCVEGRKRLALAAQARRR